MSGETFLFGQKLAQNCGDRVPEGLFGYHNPPQPEVDRSKVIANGVKSALCDLINYPGRYNISWVDGREGGLVDSMTFKNNEMLKFSYQDYSKGTVQSLTLGDRFVNFVFNGPNESVGMVTFSDGRPPYEIRYDSDPRGELYRQGETTPIAGPLAGVDANEKLKMDIYQYLGKTKPYPKTIIYPGTER